MFIKVFCLSTMYISSIDGDAQVSECFYKYNHLQPPEAANFCHGGRNY